MNGSGERYEKKTSFSSLLVSWFFLTAFLSAAVSGKMTADIAQLETEKIIASKESVDKFKKRIFYLLVEGLQDSSQL